ncbi:hypothetical protein DdX_19515 [Ditylenchus destructor]|uniref:Uncharacterized protein n=1 Tax=Ditylenchus destructor TaxID=166010 RepID=A0AAD4QX78_9BILA|nr:hypothetical protein DdX_19515 [Ditylenchus destructor]
MSALVKICGVQILDISSQVNAPVKMEISFESFQSIKDVTHFPIKWVDFAENENETLDENETGTSTKQATETLLLSKPSRMLLWRADRKKKHTFQTSSLFL